MHTRNHSSRAVHRQVRAHVPSHLQEGLRHDRREGDRLPRRNVERVPLLRQARCHAGGRRSRALRGSSHCGVDHQRGRVQEHCPRPAAQQVEDDHRLRGGAARGRLWRGQLPRRPKDRLLEAGLLVQPAEVDRHGLPQRAKGRRRLGSRVRPALRDGGQPGTVVGVHRQCGGVRPGYPGVEGGTQHAFLPSVTLCHRSWGRLNNCYRRVRTLFAFGNKMNHSIDVTSMSQMTKKGH